MCVFSSFICVVAQSLDIGGEPGRCSSAGTLPQDTKPETLCIHVISDNNPVASQTPFLLFRTPMIPPSRIPFDEASRSFVSAYFTGTQVESGVDGFRDFNEGMAVEGSVNTESVHFLVDKMALSVCGNNLSNPSFHPTLTSEEEQNHRQHSADCQKSLTEACANLTADSYAYSLHLLLPCTLPEETEDTQSSKPLVHMWKPMPSHAQKNIAVAKAKAIKHLTHLAPTVICLFTLKGCYFTEHFYSKEHQMSAQEGKRPFRRFGPGYVLQPHFNQRKV